MNPGVHLQLQLQLLIARDELLHLNLPRALQLDLPTAQQLQLVIARNELLHLNIPRALQLDLPISSLGSGIEPRV